MEHKTFSMRGDEISLPEGWDSLLCEVVQVTPRICQHRYLDGQGVVHYTIYTETSASMPLAQPSSHPTLLHR
jgi:hypothetical protein